MLKWQNGLALFQPSQNGGIVYTVGNRSTQGSEINRDLGISFA
jgi:hypothetical protein